MYIQVEGKQTLLSPTVWLNDLIIHAASLQLICKELVNQDYRLTLTIQERGAAPHCAACNKHAQLLHDESASWLLTFCSDERIQICDSLKRFMSWVIKKFVNA